jgi:hypothetical protein
MAFEFRRFSPREKIPITILLPRLTIEKRPVSVGHEPLLVRLNSGLRAAPQTHRIITPLLREAGTAQEIAERSKKSRTAGPAVRRVLGKRVHETPMGFSQGVIR